MNNHPATFDLFSPPSESLRKLHVPQHEPQVQNAETVAGFLLRPDDEITVLDLGLPHLRNRALDTSKFLNKNGQIGLMLALTPACISRQSTVMRKVQLLGAPELTLALRRSYPAVLNNLAANIEHVVRAPFIQRLARILVSNCSTEERRTITPILLKDFPDFAINNDLSTKIGFHAAVFGVAPNTSRHEVS